MRYFKQKTPTDCLLTCLECLTQRPRKEMSKELIRFSKYKKIGRILRYDSAAKILQTHFKQPTVTSANENTIKVQPPLYHGNPAIIGTINSRTHVCHSVYFDGSKVWEPWQGRFVNPYYVFNIIYIINKDLFVPNSSNSIEDLFKWEAAIQKHKQSVEKNLNQVYVGPYWRIRLKNP